MTLSYKDPKTRAEFKLVTNEPDLKRNASKNSRAKLYTIAWNPADDQKVTIDEVTYLFPANNMLSLMINDSFRFEKPEQIIAWQFNREFYCIADHDKEVGCLGILFYGSAGPMLTPLDETHRKKIKLLTQVFVDEFNTVDNIQKDMLQMLLKRLIIILTRLVKDRYATSPKWTDEKMDIVRQFNILVEQHYKEQHQVQFYADKLHKSPKTLANHFAIYNSKSPIAVIHERIISEAKRLLLYTNKSGKEIAYHLGFDDTAYFSKFFKRHTAYSLSDYKQLNHPTQQ